MADLAEGEICYAFDENTHIIKDGAYSFNENLPDGQEYDLIQYRNGEWIAKSTLNGVISRR